MNPWKTIPVADYNGHMNHPEVNQQKFLADFFEQSINSVKANSVLLAGCATGNGLDRLAGKDVEQVVAMDINRAFLDQVQKELDGNTAIEVREASVEDPIDGVFNLIFAGLLLEYVDIEIALKNFNSSIEKGGVLAVVIQLPSETLQSVTRTPYESIKSIAPVLKHVDADELKKTTEKCGFKTVYEEKIVLESGKIFMQYHFMKESTMSKKEQAGAIFNDGYNCSQSVFSSFAEECGITKDLALKLSTGFGGGISRHGEVCGAVSGGVLVLSSLFGRGENCDKQNMITTYEKTQLLFSTFSEKMGTVSCKKLLNGCELLTKEGQNEFVDSGLWDSVCLPCVECAAEIVEELIGE